MQDYVDLTHGFQDSMALPMNIPGEAGTLPVEVPYEQLPFTNEWGFNCTGITKIIRLSYFSTNYHRIQR